MSNLEKNLWIENKIICGIDEAGRGPLFGSMFVAGVIFPNGYTNDKIIDSKKLSKNKRELIYKEIVNDALDIKVVEITSEQIDNSNLSELTKKAILEIYKSLVPDICIIDWIRVDEIKDSISLPKAEEKSISVAAASIVAKHCRDEHIEIMDPIYPEYKLIDNNGYGTKKHIQVIKKIGISDLHRKSFKIKELN